ncbi:MAG: hypothetical protein Q9216_003309 [Gyalolechia sp. 2 TL-2023]
MASSNGGLWNRWKQPLMWSISLVVVWLIALTSRKHAHALHRKAQHHFSQLPSVSVEFKPPPARYNGSKIALLIEERPIKHLTPLLLHMLYVVPPEWQLFYLGSAESLSMVNRSPAIQHHQIEGKLQLKTAPQNASYAAQEQRNRMLTDVAFYREYLPAAEWLLMYHADSILCANAQTDLNDWLKYDWIVLTFQTRQDEAEPEDQWLSDRIKVLPGVKLPTAEVEKTFAVEGIWDEKPLGIHVPSSNEVLLKDVWDDAEQRKKTLEYCPEIKMVMKMKLERERCEEKTAEEIQVETEARKQVEKQIEEQKEEAEKVRKEKERKEEDRLKSTENKAEKVEGEGGGV